MSNNQDKKKRAAEFNAAREQARIDREKRVEEQIVFEASPEGREKMRVDRKRFNQLMVMAAGLTPVGNIDQTTKKVF